MSAPLEIEQATRLGEGLLSYYFAEAAFLSRVRGVIAIVRGEGGHGSGTIALDVVTDELTRCLELAALDRGVDAVHAALTAASARMRAGTPGVDPTTASVTAAIVGGEQATFIHAGGHAGYRLRGTELRRFTADHTLAAVHGPEHRGIVLRALGGPDERIESETVDVAPGDRVILVSNTVVRAVSEDELATLAATSDLQAAVRSLIAIAHERIPRDRVTAIIARVPKLEAAA